MSVVVNRDLILKLCRLAKIELSDEKLSQLTGDLRSILTFVEQIEEVDTEGVEETSQVTGLTNITRPDLVEMSEIEKDLVACTPHEITGNSLKIPKIM